ncbi:MAG: lycopene cyclase family protein [Acidimicrobiia bacterium]|nr:lycopene cyclase family protein [Acidimicrobiia bacterium]
MTMADDHVDVAVVGAGPAGLSLAHSLQSRGVAVRVVAPESPWHATYGAWRSDVDGCELGAPLDSMLRGSWDTVRVVGHGEHLLRRGYVVFDNERMQRALGAEVEMVRDTALGAEHDIEHTTLRLASGSSLQARLAIDATGSGVLLAHRAVAGIGAENVGGAQTAYGLVVGSSPHVQPEVFTLMDWRHPDAESSNAGVPGNKSGAHATFFYGACFTDGSTLVEETSLYARPPHDIDDLRRRLAARLGSDFTDTARAVEQVHIPMGRSLPARTTRVVGFGAAAGYVHPVTGYSVAGSLRAAPRVASAIAAALQCGQRGAELSNSAWQAVWPDSLVRTRAWHEAGLAALVRLPSAMIGDFFDEFFSLPTEMWAGYLRIDTPPEQVRAAMLGLFTRAGWSLRLRLASAPGGLLRALVAR